MALKRRIFLISAAAATAACSHAPFVASELRVLNPAEAALLEAWTDTLIPLDQDAGAHQAGVVYYIDRQLNRKFKRMQPAYRQALAALDRLSQGRFVEMTLDQKTTLLTSLEHGEAAPGFFPDGGKAAFEMVLAHTMQGFYGSPRHGGNRGYASWRMIGIPPLPVRGRQHYEVQS